MSYGTPLWVVQQAVYGKLTGDATLVSLATVYDRSPTNALFPYIVLQDSGTEQAADSWSGQATELDFFLDIWSRYDGFKEAINILDNCNRLLHRANLALQGGIWIAVYCRYDSSQLLRDPDGLSRRVKVKYKIMAEEL